MKTSVEWFLAWPRATTIGKQMEETLQVRQRDVSSWYRNDIWRSSLAQEGESHLCPLR